MHRKLSDQALRTAAVGGSDREALDAFTGALTDLLACPVEGDGSGAREQVATLVEARRQIDTRICRLTASLTSAAASLARADAPDDVRAGERAVREVRRELSEELRLTASQVQVNQRVGERLASSPVLAEAMGRGAVSQGHARLLDQTLKHLVGSERVETEARLVKLASRLDERQFGRECRRTLARLDHDSAMDEEARRHRRRRAAVAQTPDGMTVVNAQWSGVAGEVVHTAVHAFRRPDLAGEHRTSEQRTADAFIDALQAALDGGRAPTQHGVRPHIAITVDLATLTTSGLRPDAPPAPGMVSPSPRPNAPTVGGHNGAPDALAAPDAPNVADAGWTGPHPWGAVRQILDDSAVSFITIGNELPIAVTAEVRTVPAAVHRALVLRDQGCIHHTCDHPPQWCDVMHLAEPYRTGGKLSKTTAGLGCREHHRLFDNGELILTWTDGRPILRPPP